MSLPDLQLLLGVFDTVDAGLIVLDTDRNVLAWNQWVAAATGITEAAAMRRRLEDVFPQLTNQRIIAAITDAATSGLSSVLTHSLHPALFPLKTSDGRMMIHNVTVRRVAHDSTLSLIQITDVTVATDRDRVLRERQNARYDAVVESAPDAILTLNSEGIIQIANPAAGRQFGYLARELKDRPASTLFSDQESWASVWRAVSSGAPPLRPIELIARRKDGTSTYLEVSAAGWESAGRVFVTAILRDVNERRAAEDALRDLNQTLEQKVAERTADRDRMWRLSADVMLVARLDGTICSANPAWQSVLGWDETALIGTPLSDFVVQEDQAALRSILNELTHGRSASLFELRLRSQDGGTRQIAWSGVMADGMLQAVGRDVTTQRANQAALDRAEDALRQSLKMEALGQLTGGIAHDFNNLLTGIIGAVNLVKRRLDSRRLEDIPRFLEAASNSAHRAAALTQRMLAFARRQPLDQLPVDLNRLVLGMEDLLRRSVGEQVTLKFELADELWPAVTDANQLENALLNLVINARDAMPNGGQLVIETASAVVTSSESGEEPAGRDAGLEPGNYTTVSVIDSGTGMTPETLAKVFDPYFTTKPIGHGTGLGLSMVYGFAKQSKGDVRIESEFGHGTTVRLYLPSHDRRITQRPKPAASDAMPQGSGETVLLVEDEPTVRLLLAEILHELGYTSIEAGDAATALSILESNVHLDLMITDVGLPGFDGRQLAELGRQYRPDLKVLFVTGYAEHATNRTDFLAPGMDMVTKPFSLEDVAVAIRQMIEHQP